MGEDFFREQEQIFESRREQPGGPLLVRAFGGEMHRFVTLPFRADVAMWREPSSLRRWLRQQVRRGEGFS